MEHDIETIAYTVRIGQGSNNFFDSIPIREEVQYLGGSVTFMGHVGRDAWHYYITLPSEAMLFFKLKYGTMNENIT